MSNIVQVQVLSRAPLVLENDGPCNPRTDLTRDYKETVVARIKRERADVDFVDLKGKVINEF